MFRSQRNYFRNVYSKSKLNSGLKLTIYLYRFEKVGAQIREEMGKWLFRSH